jgi:hypothetical protein
MEYLWHPIETAPPDVDILVFFPDLGVHQVAWDSEEESWVIDDGKFGPFALRRWKAPPTHWTPLPEPPVQDAQED